MPARQHDDRAQRRRAVRDRPWPRRRSSLVATVVLVGLAALVLPFTASAARLVLSGTPRPAFDVATRCTNSALTVSPVGTAPTTQQVRVSGLTTTPGSTCVRGDVRVYSATGSATPLYVGTGSAASTFVTAGPAFVPPIATGGRVYVTIDGWPVPATWVNTLHGGCAATAGASFAAVVLSAAGALDTCEVTALTMTNFIGLQYTATVTLKNKTAAPLLWTLGLDVHKAPFGTWDPEGFSNLGATGNGATADDACGTSPLLLLRGKGTAVSIPARGTVTFSFTVHSTRLIADLTCA